MLLVLKKMLLSQGLELRGSAKRFLLLVLLQSRGVLVMHIGGAWCLPNCCMTSLQGNYRSNLTIAVEIVQFVRLRRGKGSWNQAFCCSGMDVHGLMSSNYSMSHPVSTSACIYCFRNRWYSYVNEGTCVLWVITKVIFKCLTHEILNELEFNYLHDLTLHSAAWITARVCLWLLDENYRCLCQPFSLHFSWPFDDSEATMIVER